MKNKNPEAEQILLERFHKDSLIALATVEGETPQVRVVNAFYEDGAFYVLTHRLSGKMQQLSKNPRAAIAGDWFTGHGVGKDLGWFGKEENRELAEKMKETFAGWLQNGHSDLEDENTCILKIELTGGVLFSHGMRYDLEFEAP